MRIPRLRSKYWTVVALAGVLSLPAAAVVAFDPEKTFAPDEEPRTVLRYGFQALRDGKMDDAIGAFRFGAKRNDLAAQWKLAQMLQSGQGVAVDHQAAYDLYERIARRFDDHTPTRNEMGFVAHSMVALGRYRLQGIAGSPIHADPRRAEDFFYRAAALYHDREAQYELGRLYRSELLGVKRPRIAVRWLRLAVKKGHVGAQAELGEILFNGEGVTRKPVSGLVLITRATLKSHARSGADRIRSMQARAAQSATRAQRVAARRVLDRLGLQSQVAVAGYGLVLPGDNDE